MLSYINQFNFDDVLACVKGTNGQTGERIHLIPLTDVWAVFTLANMGWEQG